MSEKEKKNLNENEDEKNVNDSSPAEETPVEEPTEEPSAEVSEPISLDEDEENWRQRAVENGATPEELATLEKLLRKTSFYAKPIIKDGSKKGKKAMAGQTIITDDDEDLSTTDGLKKDILELNASAQAKRILKGRIVGCRTAGDSKISTNMAVVEYGNKTCTVLIPEFALFHYDVLEVRTPEKQKNLERRIISMIGAEIEFVVKQFDQNTRTAYADRLKAMELKAYNNYVRRLSNTNKPRVKVGEIVQGKVVAVASKYIIVNALGAETKIWQNKDHGNEVSWHHYEDLRMLYHVNDPVPCKVLSVDVSKVKKYNDEYVLVAVELSVKRCDEDPQVKYFEDYKIGQICECKITAVNETASGIYGILSSGVSEVDCLISYPKYGDLPEVGDRRIIRITNKADKTEQGTLIEKDGRAVRRIFGVFADT